MGSEMCIRDRTSTPELLTLAAYVSKDGLVGHHWKERLLSVLLSEPSRKLSIASYGQSCQDMSEGSLNLFHSEVLLVVNWPPACSFFPLRILSFSSVVKESVAADSHPK